MKRVFLAVCSVLMCILLFVACGKNDSTVTQQNGNNIKENEQKDPKDEGKIIESDAGSIYVASAEDIAHDDETGLDYVSNIIIVYLNNNTDKTIIKNVADSVGGKVVGSIEAINMYQIYVDAPDYKDLNELCSKLQENDAVRIAAVDAATQMELADILKEQWSEFPKSQHGYEADWWIKAIEADKAWEYNDSFNQVNIGIIDAGFDYNHDELKNVIKSVSKENIPHDHGTHVAGIVAAAADNFGMAGIVWKAQLYTADVFLEENQKKPEGWAQSSQIALYLTDMIVNKNVKVVNFSMGSPRNLVAAGSEYAYNLVVKDYARPLVDLLEQGYDFLIVQSAGNGENGKSFDAQYNGLFSGMNESNLTDVVAEMKAETITPADVLDRIIIVGAAQRDPNGGYIQCEWSNAGLRVDICAPGFDVLSCIPGSYAYMSGTSMAAPIVTGVCGLVWSIDETLTGPEVKNIVCSNTKDIVKDNPSANHPLNNTYNLVNARLAVESLIEPEEVLPDGEYTLHYTRTEASIEDNEFYYEFYGMHDARIEDGMLVIDGALHYSGEYLGYDYDEGCDVYSDSKEYPRKKYKIPVADKIEWQQSWFTNTGSYYDYESNKNIAVSNIVSRFNAVFDLASNDYEKKYYSGGQDCGCVVSFTIKNGKVVYINISIPVG